MKTKKLIAHLMNLDPNGTMDIILAVDGGEGYVPLETVFTDNINKQQVDGDDIPITRKIALFLGDRRAEKSQPSLFKYVITSESKKQYKEEDGDHAEDEYKCTITYGMIKEDFEKFVGTSTKIPADNQIHLQLNTDERTIMCAPMNQKGYLGPLVDERKFNKAMFEFINGLKSITGVDDFERPITIERI